MARPLSVRAPIFGSAAALSLLMACSAPPLVRLAQSGDVPALREEIAKEKKAGKLDEGRARELARALLEGEISRASGDEGVSFVRELRACAEPLEGALRDRAEATRDAVGGEAALVLLERGAWCGDSPEDFAEDEEGAYRALAAYASDREKKSEARHRFLLDPDARVRRAAIDASLRLASRTDEAELLEISRVDPDALVRSRALVALGRIGGEEIVARLADRYASADSVTRLSFVDAWGEPNSLSAGGREWLERLASGENDGFVALHAAATLSRVEESRPEFGFGRLATFVKDGTQAERRLALRLLPPNHPETEDVLLRASEDADEEVSLLAWIRLLGRPAQGASAKKSEAEKKLLAWAQGEGSPRLQARAALAAYGSPAVLPALAQSQAALSPEERTIAGYAWIRLGKTDVQAYPALAELLADRDGEVRRRVACRLLATP